MRFDQVQSLKSFPSTDGYYSWGLFASGFEKRSTYVPSIIDQRTLRGRVALGFSEGLTLLSRPDNDKFFAEQLDIPVIIPPGNEYDEFILSELDKLLATGGNEKVSILVDYSVMTRAWYGLILNWARFASHTKPIEIDFVYANGRYMGEFDPLSISDIVALPGFEGISAGMRSTVAIFSLGFDKYATLAVYDRLEPDNLICCVADQSDDPSMALKALKVNEELCEAASRVLKLPLEDLTVAFSILSDNITVQEQTSHIVVVTLGPKPHVLASLLTSLRIPRITCLHARGVRATPLQIEAAGPINVARVTFVPEVNPDEARPALIPA